MIESAGGRMEQNIHKKIDYVVVGDQPDDDDIKLCKQLGVRIIRVRDLPTRLNYSNAEIEALRKVN
jgi:NAD-dependent DNA ligase